MDRDRIPGTTTIWTKDYLRVIDKIGSIYLMVGRLKDVNPIIKQSLIEDMKVVIRLLNKGRKHEPR